MPENFLLVPLTRLAVERVVHKQLSPHARGDRTIKEVRVVRRAVAKQVSELRLPARARHVRHDPALAVQFRERGRRVERVVHGRARVVCLVEHGEQDLAVRVDVAAWILVVVRHGLGVCGGGDGRCAEEREDMRGSEEMFHQDGRQLDKVDRAARAGDVLVFGATDHGCGRT